MNVSVILGNLSVSKMYSKELPMLGSSRGVTRPPTSGSRSLWYPSPLLASNCTKSYGQTTSDEEIANVAIRASCHCRCRKFVCARNLKVYEGLFDNLDFYRCSILAAKPETSCNHVSQQLAQTGPLVVVTRILMKTLYFEIMIEMLHGLLMVDKSSNTVIL